MNDRPKVICHMMSSIDGGLHPSRYTQSPNGTVQDWHEAYEAVHEALAGDAWLVGRVTMAEMAKGEPHRPSGPVSVERPLHVARPGTGKYAIAIDRSGKLHFRKPDINGDAVIVVLGSDVPDEHIAELAADGISYIVADGPEIDLAQALRTLRVAFGIESLLLEGGAGINGSFFAAGLVDELSVIVAPAIVGRVNEQGIVAHGDEGLAGKVQLSLIGAEPLEHDLLHLRYAVTASQTDKQCAAR
ncbi:riboflavin deaminase [Aureimonas sp. Leaf454]|uniref:RibD family protein n=1 Tax=Aureimonas sp. Leaf454 TaxID=1736381 RepID=UPI0006F9E053|nr:RibD family protein [Aureimonas sp. Leaf454]KQT44476.1 riboflavin deaminase [Aureimonas sp. Leaf454]